MNVSPSFIVGIKPDWPPHLPWELIQFHKKYPNPVWKVMAKGPSWLTTAKNCMTIEITWPCDILIVFGYSFIICVEFINLSSVLGYICIESNILNVTSESCSFPSLGVKCLLHLFITKIFYSNRCQFLPSPIGLSPNLRAILYIWPLTFFFL